jgi:hypothetical protein
LAFGSFAFLDFSWLLTVRLNWDLTVGFDAARLCLVLAVVADVVAKLSDIAAVAQWFLQVQKKSAEVVQIEIKTEAETQPSELAVSTAATQATSRLGNGACDSASGTWRAEEIGGGLTDSVDLDDGMNDELIDEFGEGEEEAWKATHEALVETRVEAETQPSELAVATAAALATSQLENVARDSASGTWRAEETGGGLTDIVDLDGMKDELIDEFGGGGAEARKASDEVIGDEVKGTPKAGKALLSL